MPKLFNLVKFQIDNCSPYINNPSCVGVFSSFEKAKKEINNDRNNIFIYMILEDSKTIYVDCNSYVLEKG